MKEVGITRLDITKNSEMDLPCNSYGDVFRLTGAKRGGVSDIKGETLTLGNRQYKACFYDKELEDNNISSNLFRGEYRLLKKDKVVSVLGHRDPKELVNNWGDLKKIYSSELEKNVFRFKTIDFEGMEKADIKAPLKYCLEVYGTRTWKKHFLNALAFNSLPTICQPEKIVEVFGEILEEMGEPKGKIKNYKYRLRNELKEGVIASQMLFNDKTKKRSLTSLYLELLEKFVA